MTNQKETMVPGQTKEKMDSASIQAMMVTILWGPTFLIQIASWVTAPVVSVVISSIFLMLAARAAKFSVEFRRNKPNEIKGFATLGLSWFTLVCCIAWVWGSLVQYFANPTLMGIITPISGIVLSSAPVTVLWFSVRSYLFNKAKTGDAERRECLDPHQ